MGVNAQSLCKHLSDLIGRPVQTQVANLPVFSPTVLFACYDLQPFGETSIVKIDAALLAAFAGTLLGFPPNLVLPMIKDQNLNEDMKDASREIMNVLAGVICDDGRPVLQGIFKRAFDYSRSAEQIVQRTALCALSVKASIAGYGPGYISIF